MGNRPIIRSQEVPRSFDTLWGWKDALAALAQLTQDMFGQTTTVVGGLTASPATPASLAVQLAQGSIYQLAALDSSSYGALPSDSTLLMQQGYAAAQSVLLSTSGLASGQSRWALIQANFSQSDAVRTGDPTGGIVQFWNSANPTEPLEGQGGNDLPLDTVRQSLVTISVVYGSIASTGSEVPPNPSAGAVPLYLVDLAFGQTAITALDILTAGPSVGTNVPTNYPYAPLLAGLLNSHHGGTPGQAPKIKLTAGAEVDGVLPVANGGLGGGLPGQVYLEYVSATQIKLIPQGGNALTVNGAIANLAAVGLSASLTGQYVGVGAGGTSVSGQTLGASKVYDLYVFNNSGTLTFEFWDVTALTPQSNHMTDTTNGNIGIEVRSNSGTPDSTRSYLGKIATNTSGQFQAQGIGVLSWFNKQNLVLSTTGVTVTGFTATALTELTTSARLSFLTFGEAILAYCRAEVSNATAGENCGVALVFNTGTSGLSPFLVTSSNANEVGTAVNNKSAPRTEGQQLASPYGQVSGGTGMFNSIVSEIVVRG